MDEYDVVRTLFAKRNRLKFFIGNIITIVVSAFVTFSIILLFNPIKAGHDPIIGCVIIFIVFYMVGVSFVIDWITDGDPELEKKEQLQRQRKQQEQQRKQQEQQEQQRIIDAEKQRMRDKEARKREEERNIQLKLAKNYETAGRFEDAAIIFDRLGMWGEAGSIRKLKNKKVSSVHINDHSTHIDNHSIKDSVIQRSNIGNKNSNQMSICPYCGENLKILKNPSFCPFCEKQLLT